MSVPFNEYEWEFWLRAEYWGLMEAMFILSGTIPCDHTVHEYEREWETGFNLEPDMDSIYKLLKRKYEGGTKSIAPKECLAWALSNNISLKPDLISKAKEIGLLEESNSKGVKDDGRGKHFHTRRLELLSLALQILDEPRPDYPKETLFKKNGKIKIVELANAVHDYKHLIWDDPKTQKNYAVETIQSILSDAINYKKSELESQK